jgi:hypothetical protein
MSSDVLQGAKNAASIENNPTGFAKQARDHRLEDGTPIALVTDSWNNQRDLHTKFIHNGIEQGGSTHEGRNEDQSHKAGRGQSTR